MTKKKRVVEYRYYDLPAGVYVKVLTGDKWVREYGDGNAGGRQGEGILHFHSQLEVGYCRFGTGELNLNGKGRRYDGGMISIIPENFPHSTVSDEGTKSGWEYLFIDVEGFLEEMYPQGRRAAKTGLRLAESIGRAALVLEGERYPEMVFLKDRIIREASEGRPFYRENIKGLLLAFLAEAARLNEDGIKGEEIKESKAGAIEPALCYIASHFTERIQIRELARVCHISETHFRRLFGVCMGMPPADYISLVRVQKAGGLLRTTNLPVNTVAERTGFVSMATFDRNFKKVTGMSPRDYRQDPGHYERKLLEGKIEVHDGW